MRDQRPRNRAPATLAIDVMDRVLATALINTENSSLVIRIAVPSMGDPDHHAGSCLGLPAEDDSIECRKGDNFADPSRVTRNDNAVDDAGASTADADAWLSSRHDDSPPSQ